MKLTPYPSTISTPEPTPSFGTYQKDAPIDKDNTDYITLFIVIVFSLYANFDRAITPFICTAALITASISNIVTLLAKTKSQWLKELSSIANTVTITTLTITMVGWVESTKTYMWLMPPCILWILSLKSLKKPLDLINSSCGPLLLACYCLWIVISTYVTQSQSNPLVLYYLNLGVLGITLSLLLNEQRNTKAMLWTMASIVIVTTWQRLLGNTWYELPLVITYKNFVSIVGLLAITMILAAAKPKTKIDIILLVITSIALLLNPSSLGKAGTGIIWAAYLWLSMPKVLMSKKNWTEQKKKTVVKYFNKASIVCSILIVIASISQYQHVSALLERGENLNGRVAIWTTAINWTSLSPIFGNGILFWYEHGGMAVSNDSSLVPIRAYNGILDPSVQSGWIASILLLAIFIGSLKNTNFSRPSKILILLGLLLCLITESHSLTGVPLDMGEATLVTLLALLWANSKNLPCPKNEKIENNIE